MSIDKYQKCQSEFGLDLLISGYIFLYKGVVFGYPCVLRTQG